MGSLCEWWYPVNTLCAGDAMNDCVMGVVGARQVKWLTTIRTSTEESPTHWQQKDYRMFSPSIEVGQHVDPASAPAIQEGNVQSAFCVPASGSTIPAGPSLRFCSIGPSRLQMKRKLTWPDTPGAVADAA
jgi:hypothetical protein